MNPKDFEIGKIYKWAISRRGEEFIWSRIKPDEMISLINNCYGLGTLVPVNKESWANDYNEITFEDLCPTAQALYLKHFTKEPSGCSCDINVIMGQGCQCGWMQKERA